jgi:hypothetical protein
MSTHSSRWGWKTVAGVALVAGAFCGGKVAFSGKPNEPALMIPAPPRLICESRPTIELAHRIVNEAIQAKTWTRRDQERATPIFNSLRTQQKIQLLEKIAAAIERKQLRVEKGARLF